MKTVEVDAYALRRVLTALKGNACEIRELQAISGLRGDECPINMLVKQYNEAVEAHNKEVKAKNDQ